jgi:hypothetical protein
MMDVKIVTLSRIIRLPGSRLEYQTGASHGRDFHRRLPLLFIKSDSALEFNYDQAPKHHNTQVTEIAQTPSGSR